jgi:hypothetical protein
MAKMEAMVQSLMLMTLLDDIWLGYCSVLNIGPNEMSAAFGGV